MLGSIGAVSDRVMSVRALSLNVQSAQPGPELHYCYRVPQDTLCPTRRDGARCRWRYRRGGVRFSMPRYFTPFPLTPANIVTGSGGIHPPESERCAHVPHSTYFTLIPSAPSRLSIMPTTSSVASCCLPLGLARSAGPRRAHCKRRQSSPPSCAPLSHTPLS